MTVEIAPEVHYLAVGKGLMRANVFLVRSGARWVLIDTGSPGCADAIQEAADGLFGRGAAATAILLTHDHPDHTGAARELARRWGCNVWAHPDEMPMITGDLAAFRKLGHPLDRWVILPVFRLMGERRAAEIMERASIEDVTRPFDPGAALPGLPDWEAVPSPGHTPGHVAFLRRTDRVLISGDALLTMKVGSPIGLLTQKQAVSGPPWFVTWDRRMARQSIARLAALDPLVLGGGHGVPMTGPETLQKVRDFAARLR